MQKKDKIKLALSLLVIVLSGIFIVYQIRGATVNLGVDLDLGGIYRIRNVNAPALDKDLATYGSVKTLLRAYAVGDYLIKWDNTDDKKLVPSIISSVGTEVDIAGNLDMNKNQILQMRIENRTTNPSSPAVGQIWICTDIGNDCQ